MRWLVESRSRAGLTGIDMDRKSWLGPPLPTVASGFRPAFLDFRRGICVANPEDHECITRILKLALEARYQQPFVTERRGCGGRGMSSRRAGRDGERGISSAGLKSHPSGFMEREIGQPSTSGPRHQDRAMAST